MRSTKYQAIALAMFFVVGAFTGCLGDDEEEETTKTTIKIGLFIYSPYSE